MLLYDYLPYLSACYRHWDDSETSSGVAAAATATGWYSYRQIGDAVVMRGAQVLCTGAPSDTGDKLDRMVATANARKANHRRVAVIGSLLTV